MISDFSGTPIGVGQVRGYRSFAWGTDGRLYGPIYGDEWVPGENVAQCHKRRGPSNYYGRAINGATAAFRNMAMTVNDIVYTMTTNYGMFTYPDTTAKLDIVPGPDNHPYPYRYSQPIGPNPNWYGPDGRLAGTHRTATRYGHGTPEGWGPETHDPHDCSCGFYCYTDGSANYPGHEDVTAAVEGYGHVTIGSRGFRAQKARIVALTLRPEYPPNMPHSVWEDTRAAIRDRWDVPIYSSLVAMRAEWPHDLLTDLT